MKEANYHLRRIKEDSEIIEENKKLLPEFVKGLRNEQISWRTIYKYIGSFTILPRNARNHF